MRRTYETNVFGVVAVTNALLPLLRRSPAPRIVNVSSGLGSLSIMSDPAFAFADLNNAAYQSSKTALNALTVLYAKELRSAGIKVNAVCPGYRATDLNRGLPNPGAGDPADGAKIAVQLPSSATTARVANFSATPAPDTPGNTRLKTPRNHKPRPRNPGHQADSNAGQGIRRRTLRRHRQDLG